MTKFRSDFLRIIEERGFIHQITDAESLDDLARQGVVTAYVGYDCTAPSLHAGNLLTIMLLRHFQQTGHRPIVLMGGGTTKVGDPSGKDSQRKLLTNADIAANMAGIREVFSKFLTFGDGPTDAIMVNNADWLDELAYIPFLRDYGVHFSVNRMLGFDSVKLRLDREQPLSFLEFNYMILQAYDFLELSRRHVCRLQMGGSDQWGNIVNGVDLGRRVDGQALYGLTLPLLTTSSGAKMGKTEAGAVWLNEDATSPYQYWQYWRNTEDADVGRFLRIFTELPLSEIARLDSLQGEEINDAKKVLAADPRRCLRPFLRRLEPRRAASARGVPAAERPRVRRSQGLLGLVALVLDGSVTSRDRALCRKTQVSCRSSSRRGRLAEAVPPPGRAPVSSRHDGQGRHRELRATDLLGTGVLDETAGRCFNAREI